MHNHNPSVDQRTLRNFWRAGFSFRKDFFLSLFIPFNALCLYTLDPFIVGKILGGLAQKGSNLEPYIIGFIVVSILGLIANRIGFIAFLSWQPKVMAKLQRECLNMLLRRGLTFHNNRVSGKLVSDAIDFPSAYSQLANTLITTLIPFVVTILSGLALITYSSPILGLLMFVMSFLAIWSGISQRRKMAPFRAMRIEANKAVTSHLADTVVNIHAVKTFARESQEMDSHTKLSHRLQSSRTHDWRIVAVQGTNRIAGLLIFELVFIILTINIVHHHPQLLAAGIFAFSYTVTLTNRLFDIGTMMRTIEEALLLAEPMTVALEEEAEVKDIPGASGLKVTDGEIDFDDVSFHYTDSANEQDVFKNLSLKIKPGEKVGLVGPSGGGKTTITKLLLRFEDIQGGSICIDGQDIASVTQQSLRENISYVPQESLLFHRSIIENISYGSLDSPKTDIIKASKNAHADDFVQELPLGYDTVVGERGVKLSGGQRQRIAIARAMLKNSPILILDEATSSLDSESEKVIQDALWKLMENRTAVIIAHRLSTIQHMDRIIVIDKGEITEEGKHHELLEKNGLYARLWKRQSGGFLES